MEDPKIFLKKMEEMDGRSKNISEI